MTATTKPNPAEHFPFARCGGCAYELAGPSDDGLCNPCRDDAAAAAANRKNKRLRCEMNKHVAGRGSCVLAEVYEEAKGGGWFAVFDCEHAALRAYYVYRGSPGVRLGYSKTYEGHYISVRPFG